MKLGVGQRPLESGPRPLESTCIFYYIDGKGRAKCSVTWCFSGLSHQGTTMVMKWYVSIYPGKVVVRKLECWGEDMHLPSPKIHTSASSHTQTHTPTPTFSDTSSLSHMLTAAHSPTISSALFFTYLYTDCPHTEPRQSTKSGARQGFHCPPYESDLSMKLPCPQDPQQSRPALSFSGKPDTWLSLPAPALAVRGACSEGWSP